MKDKARKDYFTHSIIELRELKAGKLLQKKHLRVDNDLKLSFRVNNVLKLSLIMETNNKIN